MRLRWLSPYYASPAELDVIDLRDGLLIRTVRKPSLLEALVSCAVTGASAALVGFFFIGKREMFALATLSAALGFLIAKRARRFELHVTRLEFVPRGTVGGRAGSMRSVCTADILWLEYQEGTAGDNPGSSPRGLYAVSKGCSICLLPEVDERMTASVIERIKDRFPDFRAQWAAHSPFGTHFISLGLDVPRGPTHEV